ncbi:hypothetical protein C8J57DRAFT_1511672 [Mycena rebaudengoi]|nr:hypothetical protein C8J57DRAFT_1511672 [Mycena rebaudengoi]
MWDPIDVRQSELYAVLRSVPRLTRLHLLFVDCIDFSDVAVDPLVLSHLIHLEFAPVSMGSCRLLGRVVMPILQTLVLAIEPSRLVVPVISICGPAFRTVVAAALTLRGATSMEFDAIVCGMPSLCRLDCRRSGSGTAESLLEIGSGVYGRFPLLSLVVADSRTRNSGSELAKLLLGGGVFASSFEVILRIGGLDGGTFVKYCLEGSATVETVVVDSSHYGLD